MLSAAIFAAAAIAIILTAGVALYVLNVRDERSSDDAWEQFSHGDGPHLPRTLNTSLHDEPSDRKAQRNHG